jgi:NAD(P)-dependent dehydrogenase (short-subunit alcohol dehydrogenase family)
MTAEGFEKTFAIGYLSAFVLCTQLSPLLAATPGARIVNVAAQAKSILNLKLDFEHLDFNQNYNGFKVSLMTVHAKTVLTAILAEKFATQGISVNAFHPGVVRSRLTRNLPYFFRLLTTFFSPLMVKTSESGCYVCSHPNISGITGQLFEKQTPRSLQFGSNYKEALWQKTIQLLSTIQKLNT